MAEISRIAAGCVVVVTYDDVLTREIVLSRKWQSAAICKKFVHLRIKTGAILEIHCYPKLDDSRVRPLEKLLTENKISYYCSAVGEPKIVKAKPEKKVEQFVPKTKAEYAQRRKDGIMAAAAKVLDHKAKQAERAAIGSFPEDDENAAMDIAGDREVDCW